MIACLSQEEVVTHWEALKEPLSKFWDATINFETLDNLKRRLLAEHCKLFIMEGETYRFLFVGETRSTASGTIFVVTHTAGINKTGKRWSLKDLKAMHQEVFGEIEEEVRKLGFLALCIHARPGHLKLAEGYDTWYTPIIKKL